MHVPDIDVPLCADEIWRIYWSIRVTLPVGMSAPDPLQARHILDWQVVFGDVISRQEAEIMLAMDAAYRNAWQEEADNNAAMAKDYQ